MATLGFRGEALPSHRLGHPLHHPVADARGQHGATLELEGGKVGAVQPDAHPAGTTVEVRDLFYNVPARRKFLRTERTELAHAEEWLRSLALGASSTSNSASA